MADGLTNRQRIFVEEYLRSFNATQSAISAGYSPKNARFIGAENLTKLNVAEEIKRGIAERAMPKEEVLTRLADIARGNITDLMDVTHAGFEVHLLKDGEINPKTKLIKKIKQKVTTYLAKSEDGEDREIIETEIELYSAHDALRDIGKIHGLFVDRAELTGKDGGPIQHNVMIYVPDNNRPRNGS